MSVRSFHSVFMASAVAGAALGCYLVSLRVASERAALEQVETRIVLAQRDIRLLQTEIGTRARLAQLERWNVRVLSLSAPTADQILGDKFQLASLIAPQRKPAFEAPVVLASAPAATPQQPLAPEAADETAPAPFGQLLHQASVEMPVRDTAAARPVVKRAAVTPPKPDLATPIKSASLPPLKPASVPPAKAAQAKAVATKTLASRNEIGTKKAGEKSAKPASAAVTRPVRTANVDPLAPLPAGQSIAEASRTNR
jgi:hypothetical protein